MVGLALIGRHIGPLQTGRSKRSVEVVVPNTGNGRQPRSAELAAKGVGIALTATRWLDRRLSGSARTTLAEQVERLVVAHDRLASTTDRRLRSLEESAARAEAEMRFMASLLVERDGSGAK